MKRTLEANLPTATPSAASNNNTGVVNPPKERLLLVLVPMEIANVRKTLGIQEKGIDVDYLSIFEYVVGSADPELELEARLKDLVEEHRPFQDHPECIGDVDMTSLPLLLFFISGCCNVYQIYRLPRELTHAGEEATPFATVTSAKRKVLGTWDDDITEGDDTYTHSNGPYKAVHFIPYDPAVVANVIERQKLHEDV
jgi:hypothetical protein